VRHGRIYIVSTNASRTKSGRWRDVPISPGAQVALDLLAGENGEFVLPRMTGPSLSRAFRKALERAGLAGRLHDLRHTFCSQLAQQGVPLRTIQVLAGHQSYATTEVYAHLSRHHLEVAVGDLRL
jgi:integrase